MYQIRLLDAAAEEVRSLDRAVARRIVQRIEWLAENFEMVNREALTGQFAGLLKFRVGDYRVLYEVLEVEQSLLFTLSGIVVMSIADARRHHYRRS